MQCYCSSAGPKAFARVTMMLQIAGHGIKPLVTGGMALVSTYIDSPKYDRNRVFEDSGVITECILLSGPGSAVSIIHVFMYQYLVRSTEKYLYHRIVII